MDKGMKYIDADIKSLIDSVQQEQNSIQDAELTVFESALFTAFSYAWHSYLMGEEVNVAQWAKENSAELLEAARCQQKQQGVDLEKEIDACWRNWLSPSNQKEVEGVLPKTEFAMYARHFYELGLNARKEESK